MPLIIATGSNLNDRLENLETAQNMLSQSFKLLASSSVFTSDAVDYSEQPAFLNQVLEFDLPDITPIETMTLLLNIEKDMGRIRNIPRGPRIIDLDILFWDMESIETEGLLIPHPRWIERSFVVRPLMELPFYEILKKYFTIPTTFTTEATPIPKD